MITPFRAFQVYMAIKFHFTTKSYDFFKFNGKTKGSNLDVFENRKDRFFFTKVSKIVKSEDDLVDFMVANTLDGRKFIGDYISEDGIESYNTYQKEKQSATYTIKGDIEKLFDSVENPAILFRYEKNGYPRIVEQYLSGDLSKFTLPALDNHIKFTEVFDQKYGDDVIWMKISMEIRKLKPFIEYNHIEIVKILKGYI